MAQRRSKPGPTPRVPIAATGKAVHFSHPLLRRLASYYQISTRFGEEGHSFISSAYLAALLGIDATLVRKDMAVAGVTGRPKVGYPINTLLPRLDQVLGLTDRNDAILIGCGDLGSAIARYNGFSKYGLKISAIFDIDLSKVGKTIAGLSVLPMEKCRSYIEIFAIEIAILTVPGSQAQELADWLSTRGVRAIWNFTPVHLKVSPSMIVRNENLAIGLAQLLHELKQARIQVPKGSGTAHLIDSEKS